MRKPVVVDTNVLLVANGGPSHKGSCILACATQLTEIQKSGCVVLDQGHEILGEYAKKQSPKGQPGIGFHFWKWLLNTKRSSDHCQFVKITKVDPAGYEEFPDHKDLAKFDPSDKKFVAVAVAHGSWPPIYQAADSKWWGWKGALQECQITVEFLCPKEIEAKFQKKKGNV
jgi:hypothetical protein